MQQRNRKWAGSRVASAVLVALLTLVATACTGDSSGDDGIIADGSDTSALTADTTDAGSNTDPDATEDSTAPTDGDTTTDTTGSESNSDSNPDSEPNPGSGSEAIEGLCGVDEVNRQSFYAVDNIPADDPDGGLNVRDNYAGGEVLLTLAPGTVVYAEDCYRAEDGGIWYAISTPEAGGWANAAFLSEDIPVLQPTFGGGDTEDAVTALLDALAAQDWDDAAAQLQLDDEFLGPFATQLPEPDQVDLATWLEGYCAIRVCDAPYTITDVRGSYRPERVSPEVDVAFTYPGGVATETFTRFTLDDEFAIAELPGRSLLALVAGPSSTEELVESFDPADEGLYEAAERIRLALLSEQGPRIPQDHLAAEGASISADAYVQPALTDRVVVTAADLDSGSNDMRIWGYTDGVGSPIVDTVDGFMAEYRRSLALLEPDTVGIDRRVGLGNTIDNLAAEFPEARIVEYHRRGRGELADFNWSSVRMALELRDGDWQLVGLTSDGWTV